MVLDKEFIFIVGAPRSGTTWLQLLVSSHPKVVTTVEQSVFGSYVSKLVNAWETEERINDTITGFGLPFLWTTDEFNEFICDFLTRVYRKIIEKNIRATHILDKHPGHSYHIQSINYFLPHARFIHIIRDGRDASLSSVKTHEVAGFGASSISRAAELWKRHVLEARRAAEFKERYIEIRYENLHSNTIETMKSVFDFCGLEIAHDEINQIVERHEFSKLKRARTSTDPQARAAAGHYRKGKVGSWKHELSPYECFLIERACGDLLCELNYAAPGWWASTEMERHRIKAEYSIRGAAQLVRDGAAVASRRLKAIYGR